MFLKAFQAKATPISLLRYWAKVIPQLRLGPVIFNLTWRQSLQVFSLTFKRNVCS